MIIKICSNMHIMWRDRRELVSRLIFSTVNEVVLVALKVEVMKHNRRKIRKTKTAFSICPVTCKGFPSAAVYCPSLAMYVEMDAVCMMCIQVQLQASFSPKRLPRIFSLCINFSLRFIWSSFDLTKTPSSPPLTR